MIDGGLEQADVTGRWVGFYRHRTEQLGTYPIVAEIQQTGNKITGEMYDQITERSFYLDDYLEVLEDQIRIDSRRKIEQVIRQFGTEIVSNSRLPDTSDIHGTIKGCQVQFTKTYRGAMEVVWTVGEKQVGAFRRDRHQVQYSSHLDRERMCIVGEWVISQWRQLGQFLPPQARGSFELYKKT
jgi:hypothetical protein